MFQSRSRPILGSCGGSGRRVSGCRSAPPPPQRGPPTQSCSHRVAAGPTNNRNRPSAPPRPLSSERPVLACSKTPANSSGRNEQPLKPPVRQAGVGINRKSPRIQNKRPPFVVGTGNSGVGCRTYAITKTTESRARTSTDASKDRRAVTGNVPLKESRIEAKTKSDRPAAAHRTETMTLVSDAQRQLRDRVETPTDLAESATFIVADPLPEVFLHRANRKQNHPSADECIRQAAEKLSEFAAMQNSTSPRGAVQANSSTGFSGGRRPSTGNDVIKESRRCVAESPRPPALAHDIHSVTTQPAGTVSGGNDVSKRAVGSSKKVPEVVPHRTASTKLSAACRPSPTRSSLLRQALNCPGSVGASQHQRIPRPTQPAVDRTHRSATEVGTGNHHLQRSIRQQVAKQGRASSVQTLHNAAFQPKGTYRQSARRSDPKRAASASATRDLSLIGDRRSVDAESSRTYNVDGASSSLTSSLSSPRTFVDVLPTATDDERSAHTSPRVADKLTRRCRRRRPQSVDDARVPKKDGKAEVGCSSSTETFVYTKPVSLSTDSLRQKRRRRSTTSTPRELVMMSSTPNLPEVRRPVRRRRSSASSEGDAAVAGRAEPVDVRGVPGREFDAATTNKFCGVSDRHLVSRLPRLVTRPQDTLPSSSSVTAAVVKAPRPRSFRYSRLHRRAVDAFVPPPLHDMPWRWALKVRTDNA